MLHRRVKRVDTARKPQSTLRVLVCQKICYKKGMYNCMLECERIGRDGFWKFGGDGEKKQRRDFRVSQTKENPQIEKHKISSPTSKDKSHL